ncbi:MAG: ROK family protein, partial [Planctomycetia bacterium]|nr:ROK family protein [Planctomycetia bacterium]
MAGVSGKKPRICLGIDVGGTKIQVSAITETGVILASRRAETPRDVAPSKVMDVIAETIVRTLEKIDLKVS